MSTIVSRIEKFIADNELDVDVKDMEKLVKACFGDLFELMKETPVHSIVVKEKSEKLDDPSKAQTRDSLRDCTKEILNVFCKENGLRVGGTKKEVMDRVWRFTQDESSDEDISPRSEKKKIVKNVVEKLECCGITAKGTPCNVPAEEEQICGKCYCWRHAKVAIAERKKEESEKGEYESDE